MNETTTTRMVEDIKDRLGFEEYPGIIEDVANNSADAGFSGFTYTSECVEFYNEHEDAIYELLLEDADSMGYSNIEEMVSNFGRSDMLDSPDGRKNLLAWYALETVCRRLVDEGAHILECEECCSILEDDGSCFDCDHADAEDEPEDDDYIIQDDGVYQSGKLITDATEWEDCRDAIKAHMDSEQFYPNVWILSDHGNAHLTTLED